MTDLTVLAQAAAGPGPFDMLFPFLLIIPVFYFLIIRPQNKKVKEHQEMVAAVKRGDTVVTQGGLIGKVVKVKDDNEVEIELAKDVVVRAVQSTLVDVRVKNAASDKKKD